MAAHGRLRALAAALVPVAATIGWVLAAGLAARSIPDTLRYHPRIAEVAVYGIAMLGGLGGLLGFWYSASSIEFFVRGYQVRFQERIGWCYEERTSTGAIRRLPFGYKALADKYRPPCEVYLPSQQRWNDATPAWAHGRRREITENIKKDLGADFGRSVEVIDS
jgi:hypothetical protein